MPFLTRIVLLMLLFFAAQSPQRVVDNVLISDTLPAIKIKVDPTFNYIGSFPFEIEGIAAGHRYVFADIIGKKINRLVIAQFEGFLPESSEIYRYSFANAITINGYKLNHSTFAFSNEESIRENPKGEGSLTFSYLKEKGYVLPEEWIVSRFLTLGDENRKSELILFYQEDLESTGHKMSELYENDEHTEVMKSLSPPLKERALKAISIQK